MAKKNMEEIKAEEININDINIDDTLELTQYVEVPKVLMQDIENKVNKTTKPTEQKKLLINCLKNTRIIVRYILRATGLVSNPKHVLYGGLAENAIISFVVPRLSSGMYVNVLTDNEKDYLEHVMGLDEGALSIYKKKDNFWDDSNENGISRVRLTKLDNILNLADPQDYIRYKILLANKNQIAPSLQALQDTPRATYRFVLIEEGEEAKQSKNKMSTTMECYKEFGKVQDDNDVLRVILESLDGRPTAKNSTNEFLQTRINEYILRDSKVFLKIIKDPLLSNKVLIKKCIEEGILAKRGDYIYLRENNTPLCANGLDPTLNVAAKYLALPKLQDLKFSLEAKLKQS